MIFQSRTLPEFWDLYYALPFRIQELAKKQHAIFLGNPRHPSLQLKPVGAFWSVRINEGYRALALREGNTFIWFWIGTHSDYDRLV